MMMKDEIESHPTHASLLVRGWSLGNRHRLGLTRSYALAFLSALIGVVTANQRA